MLHYTVVILYHALLSLPFITIIPPPSSLPFSPSFRIILTNFFTIFTIIFIIIIIIHHHFYHHSGTILPSFHHLFTTIFKICVLNSIKKISSIIIFAIIFTL